MPIEVYSFFSGVGFLDLGFEDAGFDIVFVNEKNERFLNSYQYARQNRNHVPRYGYSNTDVKEFLSDDVWKRTFPDYGQQNEVIKGFIGGPPCPDFSTAGKNKGENGQNGHLTTVYVDLIIKRQPDFFVFENVKGLYQTKKHRDYYEKLKKRLYKAGYTLFDSIENAIEYGLEHIEMTKMRTQQITIGQATIIDDSYKSNPESAKVALDTLSSIPTPCHIAVLSDMLDLGENEKSLHAQIGTYAHQLGIDYVFCVGDLSFYTADAAQGTWFDSKQSLIQALRPFLDTDCAILVKGSRATAMDQIITDLQQGENE